MKKYIIVPTCILGLIVSGFLSGCNTVTGLGRDVSSAGRSIQQVSN